MPTRAEFEAAISKELTAIRQRNTDIETMLAMNNQATVTLVDLIARMNATNDSEEIAPASLDGVCEEKIPDPPQVKEEQQEQLAVSRLGIDVTPVTVSNSVRNWGKLTSPSGALEKIVMAEVARFTSPAIPMHPSCVRVRRGPLNVRDDLPVTYMDDWDKNVDRIDDVNLRVFLFDTNEPFQFLARAGMPGGFYCFTADGVIEGADIYLSIRSVEGIVIYKYSIVSNKEPTVEIYGDITQDTINTQYVDNLLASTRNTLQRLANYALESPDSRTSRHRVHHLCSLA